jgi:hypothetical protein
MVLLNGMSAVGAKVTIQENSSKLRAEERKMLILLGRLRSPGMELQERREVPGLRIRWTRG